jgi:PKD repeat protein
MVNLFIRKAAILLVIAQLLIVPIIMQPTANVKAAGERTINVQDQVTGLNYINLGNESEPLPAGGLNFSIKLYLSGAIDDLISYQVGVIFNKTYVRATSVSLPTDDSSFVFHGQNFYQVSSIDNNGTPVISPMAIGGAALKDLFHPVDVSSGLLCTMNFTAIKAGNITLSVFEPQFGLMNVYTLFMIMVNGVPISEVSYTSESLSLTIVAAKSPPIASFTYSPQTPKANDTILFDARSSYDPDGEIVSYAWDFGDNATATTNETRLTHKYVKNGLYPVNLTVRDNDGFNRSTTGIVLVGSLPYVNFTWTSSNPPFVMPGDVVTFNATESSAAANSSIVSYYWDFGDQTNATTVNATVTHTYARRGVFQVNLTVTDNDDLFNSTAAEVQVGVPPVVSFSYEPARPKGGDAIAFAAVVTTETNVSIASYNWDFGEGLEPVTANGTTIEHTFEAGGNYTVTLVVYDTDGLHGTYVREVEVFYETLAGSLDYTWYIVAPIVAVVILAAIVVKRRRSREEEELIDL